jgi:replicative DNA helicase
MPTPWPPLGLSQRRLPPFPMDVLPEWMGEHVTAITQEAHVSVDAPALLTIAALGAAAAKRVEVRFGIHEVHHTAVWVLSVMPPSEGKTPLIRAVAAPFRRVQQELHDTFAAGEIERRVEETVLRARHRQAATRAANLDASPNMAEREEARAALRDLEQRLAALRSVRERCLLIEDSTPEALVQVLAENDGVGALFSDEGSVLFGNLLRAYGEGLQHVESLLKTHSAEDIRVHRVSRPPLVVRTPVLSVVIATQPSVVRGLLRRGAFQGRGVWERFVFVLPPSTVGTGREGAASFPLLPRYYGRAVSSLLELPVVGTDGAERRALRFEPEAERSCNMFFREVDRRMAEGGDLSVGAMRGWAGKLRTNVIRMAGILHLADSSSTPSTQSNERGNMISARSADGAVRIARWAVEHARVFLAGDVDQDDDIDAVVRWIRRRQLPVVRPRDIQHGLAHRFTSREILERTIAALVEAHALRPREDAPPATGRPPVEYDVHPDLLRAAPGRQNDESAG